MKSIVRCCNNCGMYMELEGMGTCPSWGKCRFCNENGIIANYFRYEKKEPVEMNWVLTAVFLAGFIALILTLSLIY